MKGFFAFPILIYHVFGTPVFADYQKGLNAAESGDYATALKEWKPFAEQGYANAQNGLVFCTIKDMASPRITKLRSNGTC